MKGEFQTNLNKNLEEFKRKLHLPENFDIAYRVLNIGPTKAALLFVDGFTKDDIVEKILEFLMEQAWEVLPKGAHEFSKRLMPYGEIGEAFTMDTAVTNLLSGMTLLLVDGYDTVLTIDCRTYPVRSMGEPEKDKVMRGSKDGFVETLVFNTALIRRRIRDPELIVHVLRAGSKSKTDIAVCFMNGVADAKLVETIESQIRNIKVEALTMNQESLAECLSPGHGFNPFPKFKYSERPDATAAHLLEGNIAILVDNSPSAMLLPATIFDIIEESNDYYFPPVTGTYLRLSRTLMTLAAFLLPALFLLGMEYQHRLPQGLQFVFPEETIHIPLFVQILILELAVDGLKLAAVNTPSMLSTPLSLLAAIVIGDFSVSSGFFNSEVMLIMAFCFVANLAQSNFEVSYALKFMRVILTALTYFFGIWGFAGGLLVTFFTLLGNKTIGGHGYLEPLIPFRPKKFFERFVRKRLSSGKSVAK